MAKYVSETVAPNMRESAGIRHYMTFHRPCGPLRAWIFTATRHLSSMTRATAASMTCGTKQSLSH